MLIEILPKSIICFTLLLYHFQFLLKILIWSIKRQKFHAKKKKFNRRQKVNHESPFYRKIIRYWDRHWLKLGRFFHVFKIKFFQQFFFHQISIHRTISSLFTSYTNISFFLLIPGKRFELFNFVEISSEKKNAVNKWCRGR